MRRRETLPAAEMATGLAVLPPLVAVLATALATVPPIAAAAAVRLEDNLYQGIVIGIDERLEAQRCREIVDGVQVCAPLPLSLPLLQANAFSCLPM